MAYKTNKMEKKKFLHTEACPFVQARKEFQYVRAPFAFQLVEPNKLAEWTAPQMFSPKNLKNILLRDKGKLKRKRKTTVL